MMSRETYNLTVATVKEPTSPTRQIRPESGSPLFPSKPSYSSLNPYNPGDKQKTLRTAPRKLGEIDEKELNDFEKWLEVQETKLQRNDSYKKEEHKTRTNRAVSIDESRIFKENDPYIYRRVLLSSIPNHLKPQYEQDETLKSCSCLMDLLEIRDKYIYFDKEIFQHPLVKTIRDKGATATLYEALKDESLAYYVEDGVYKYKVNNEPVNIGIISAREFYSDLQFVLRSSYEAPNKSFCYTRLKLLQMKFQMHMMCNANRENIHVTSRPSKDFYSITKVDNHVHLSAAMNQKHLLKFIKRKLKTEPDTIVTSENGNGLTLKQVFDSLGIRPESLTVDVLNCYADKNTFHRFDRFNNKYNPIGQAILREIFLQTDNYFGGKFFAEIVKELINELEIGKYVLAEYRLSIYGRSYDDWQNLSHWFVTYNMKSNCVKYLIQIARLYKAYKQAGDIESFQEMLRNIFEPIIKATLEPEAYPEIAETLTQVVGFDTIDNENKIEKVTSYSNYKVITPEDWTASDNPPYSYFNYYIYANIVSINHLRRARGMNTFSFRPHCGEAGSGDHLATAYLIAHSINHGIELKKSPVLQYLYYLKQIGLSVSPLSNNKLVMKFLNNPFQSFFAKGLNVALSTDDPLMIHLTREPLLEEYNVVTQALDMTVVDMCEIARNSVLQSGFSLEDKKRWLGKDFQDGWPNSYDPHKSNVSWIRFSYRFECFQEEMDYISRHIE
ncbi:unnamed protein product [Blepharisma stoltei]|uniref:AMP deaminase n=1 Tax=Blepharisma stoltei TaxID=1481888 RepID=A0AAU9JR20_9CILI|nr:unnamed protein product [Blepharisma stoltei]